MTVVLSVSADPVTTADAQGAYTTTIGMTDVVGNAVAGCPDSASGRGWAVLPGPHRLGWIGVRGLHECHPVLYLPDGTFRPYVRWYIRWYTPAVHQAGRRDTPGYRPEDMVWTRL